MNQFHYIYILESLKLPGRFYTGLTCELRERLKRHNAGGVPHTSKFTPWRIKSAVAFAERGRAAAFEIYLKTASGRAFAKNAYNRQLSRCGFAVPLRPSRQRREDCRAETRV